MSLRIAGLLLALVVVVLGASASPVPAQPALPNVVVIITDDEPAFDGRLINLMPNAKAIWKNAGVSFTDFHIETPLCCPARAGFLTGQHTLNHGVFKNDVTLFKPAMSLATQLHGLGYHTMLAGKYLNLYEKIAPTVPPGWDRFAAMAIPTGDSYYGYDYYTDGNPTAEHHGTLSTDYSTDVLKDKAVAQILAAPAGQPIFSWIGVTAPHSPLTPAPRYQKAACPIAKWLVASSNEADASDKPDYVKNKAVGATAAYNPTAICRTQLAVDDLVGGVRDALTTTGRINNTIFVYTSDNGFFAHEQRLTGKGWPYVTDVPFYVSWPAGLPAGPRSIGERVQNIDFAPTICALVGCTLGPYPNGQTKPDGLSFAGLLLGTQTTLNRDAVIGHNRAQNPTWYSVTTTGADKVVAGGPWLYIEDSVKSGVSKELYDISGGPCYAWSDGQPGDPCMLNNKLADPSWQLVPANGAILAGLQARLAALKAEQGAP